MVKKKKTKKMPRSCTHVVRTVITTDEAHELVQRTGLGHFDDNTVVADSDDFTFVLNVQTPGCVPSSIHVISSHRD